MGALLKRRWLAEVVGVGSLAYCIWVIGPYVTTDGAARIGSIDGRPIVIAAVLLSWAIVRFRRYHWYARATVGDGTAAKRVRAALDESPRARDAASVTGSRMQTQLDEAIVRIARANSESPGAFERPWHALIGPPRSGKTTALAALRMDAGESLTGAGSNMGNAATDCNWLLTEKAVVLDTPGRFASQRGDPDADADGWAQLLLQLKKRRPGAPLDGVLIAYSAADLLERSSSELAADAAAIRQRLADLDECFQIRLPVYLMVTKVDLIGGFREYFANLDDNSRRQVWGFTFALADSNSGRALRTVSGEFDGLLERIHAGIRDRLCDGVPSRACAALFAFPAHFVDLKSGLLDLIRLTFEAPGTTGLRGVYFTSARQAGSAVDRFAGELHRSHGVQMSQSEPPVRSDCSYFIERLLHEVLPPEACLVRTRWAPSQLRIALKSAAYWSVGIITFAAFTTMAVSYILNRSYLEKLSMPVARFVGIQRDTNVSTDPSQELDSLSQLRTASEIADLGGSPPRWMGAGLYQGRSARMAAEGAYERQLNAVLGPALARSLEKRIESLLARPEQLGEYVDAYRMLGEPERLASDRLLPIALAEWDLEYPGSPELRATFIEHLGYLLSSQRLGSVTLDSELIERAEKILSRREDVVESPAPKAN